MTDKEIEEQAEKMYPSIDQSQLGHKFMQAERKSFIEGAKWMQERDKWISVDDRLPENRSHVLAHTTNGGYTTTAEYKHGCWFKGLDRLYCVTHWQPLPLHPKD